MALLICEIIYENDAFRNFKKIILQKSCRIISTIFQKTINKKQTMRFSGNTAIQNTLQHKNIPATI